MEGRILEVVSHIEGFARIEVERVEEASSRHGTVREGKWLLGGSVVTDSRTATVPVVLTVDLR